MLPAGERRKSKKEQEEMKHLTLVIGDAVVTGIWVMLSSTFGEVWVSSTNSRSRLSWTAR